MMKKMMNSTAMLVTGFACAASILTAAVGVAPAQGAELPARTMPGFVGIQLKTDSFNIETLDQVHAAGFRVVRRGIYWNAVEKEKGVYNFDDYDKQMAHARELGLTVIACLFAHNKLYEGGDATGFHHEAERKGFAAFAAAAAAHYKDFPVLWEIWNEPNVRTFWGKHGTHNTEQFADEYTALVKEVAPAMVKAVPDAFVMAGSVSNYWKPSYEWTEFCFKKGILKTGIKGWSVHPYGVRTPEEFAVGHKITRDLLKKYGAPDMPMLDTERGFTVKERAEGYSGGTADRLNDFQSWQLVRQYMIDQLHDVSPTVWYEWGGDEGFGLQTAGGPAPAFDALKTMVAQLSGYTLTGRIDTGYDLDYVLLWEGPEGQKKLVVWTAPPATQTPDNAFPHEVEIRTGTAGEVTVVNLMGEASTAPNDGKSLRVKVSGAPQYVGVLTSSSKVTAKSVEPFKAPVAAAGPAPVGSVDLKAFEPGAEWKFIRNTGDGSFELSSDDTAKATGVLKYDFTQSKAGGTPYVLATGKVNVEEGTTAVRLLVRSDVAQPLTFRLLDSTGQTLQYKTRIKGAGQWEVVTIPLTKKLESWGGAKDGKPHFPLTSISFSVPLPGEANKTGRVEYAELMAVR